MQPLFSSRQPSTFKILNSLTALETGAIANDLAILTWNGIPRTLPTWNRDLNLREAFKISAVWFYQSLPAALATSRCKGGFRPAYGNQTIGNPDDIDRF